MRVNGDTIWFLFQIISGFFHEYQGILRYMHFKLLWFIMFLKDFSNWMEVYVAYSSPLFETLNVVYSSAFNTVTIRKSRWLPFRLSDYKTRQFPNISYYVRRILYIIHRNMQSWWEFIMIKVSCQSFIRTGYFSTSCILPMPDFQELNSKSEIIFNNANP